MAAAALVASVAFGAMATMAQNKGAAQAAGRQVRELTRQQKRESEIGREKRADIKREEDRAIGEIIAAQADTGATTNSIALLASAESAIAGLNVARVTSNVDEANRARRAEQISIVKTTQNQILSNTISFFAQSAGAVASHKTPAKAAPKSAVRGTGPSGGGEG